jgi:DNA-directed RNA polymerase specialized sigma24 family protein
VKKLIASSILLSEARIVQATYKRIDEIPAERGLPTLAEYAAADDCPLLKLEWHIICRKAHLTERQCRAFEWYHIYGLPLTATAVIMNCEVRTVRSHLEAAYSRLKRVPHQGIVTVLIELFGLADTLECLND